MVRMRGGGSESAWLLRLRSCAHPTHAHTPPPTAHAAVGGTNILVENSSVHNGDDCMPVCVARR